ncbi:MAG: DUF1761 domain-containing protein [Gammaproteobacteria bacterium]|nr:DUF1761 domain-containing protein [Gammaproteobacteria bacterium]
MEQMVQFNIVAILVATVVAYALGAIWYMPKLFGNAWMSALGKTPEELGSPVRAMSLNFFATLLTAIVLAWLLAITGAQTAWEGFYVSLIASIGLLGTSMYADHLFAATPIKLLLITGGYRIVHIVLMGTILGAW